MILDLPSLMVGEGFVLFCTAFILLFSAWQSRESGALLLLGIGNACAGLGLGAFIMLSVTGNGLWGEIGPVFFALGGGFLWASARRFHGKSAPYSVMFLAAGLALLIGAVPAFGFGAKAVGIMATAGTALYSLAAVHEYWSGRSERLGTRWLMMLVTLLQGGVLAVGAVGQVIGVYQPDMPAQLGSWFGLVHFIDLSYAVGATVSLLGMVKERSELASRHSAEVDVLTGLPTRRAFMNRAADYLDAALEEQSPLSLIIFDLDCFKEINDSYGHGCGDTVLREFGEVMRSLVRTDDFAGRLGGEEFALILPGLTAGAAFVIAERIRLAFAAAAESVDGRPVAATLSGGLAAVHRGSTIDTLIESADKALYRAKAAGRNRVISAERKHDGGPPLVVRVA